MYFTIFSTIVVNTKKQKTKTTTFSLSRAHILSLPETEANNKQLQSGSFY